MTGARPKLTFHVSEWEPIEARPGWIEAERRVRSKLAKLDRIDVHVSDRVGSTRSEPLKMDGPQLVRFCTDLDLDLAEQDGTKGEHKRAFAAEVVDKTIAGNKPDFSGFAPGSHYDEIRSLLQELHDRAARILPQERRPSVIKALRDAYIALVTVYAPEPADPAHELTRFLCRTVPGIIATEATLAADAVTRALWPQYIEKNLERTFEAVGARKRKREAKARWTLTGIPRELFAVGAATEPKT
jgi:hypothetical protein